MKLKNYLAICLIGFSNIISFGQSGNLDTSFNSTGIVITDFGGSESYGRAIAIQPDNKIVAVGRAIVGVGGYDFSISRYNANGRLDSTFNFDGKADLDFFGGFDFGEAVVVQTDGKIIVAGNVSNSGTVNFGLARFYPNGLIDSTFGINGKVYTPINSESGAWGLALQTDGKIVAVGNAGSGFNAEFALARYNQDGMLDTSFNNNGIVTTKITNAKAVGNAIAIQPDGKIVICGALRDGSFFDFATLRYHANGLIDSSFSLDGIVTTDFNGKDDLGFDIALQQDGKILVVGFSKDGTDQKFAIVRYNLDGTLDNNFNTSGKVTTDFGKGINRASAIVVQPNKKIVVVGDALDSNAIHFALARYNNNGTLDNTFNTNGLVITPIEESSNANAVKLQPDGKIVVVGDAYKLFSPKVAVVRYLSGLSIGIIEFSIQSNSMLVYPNPLKEVAHLKFELLKNETLDVLLYNMEGKLIQTFLQNVKKYKGKQNITLKFNPLTPSGMYVLIIQNAAGVQENIRIIKE